MKFGDFNSKIFHAITVNRRQRNKVVRVKNDDCAWLDSEEEIGDCSKDFFFIELFSYSGRRNLSHVLNFVGRKVTDDMNSKLIKFICFQEVKAVVFQLGRDEAPGPDSFSRWFYHFSWEEISLQIFELVNDFMDSGRSIDLMNKTNIILIPKVDKPIWVTKFRPIIGL